MNAYEILEKNEALIKLVTEHEYVPHKDHANFQQIIEALKIINPKASYRSDCSGCIGEVVRMAGVHLQAHRASKATFKTFPLQRKPGRPRK